MIILNEKVYHLLNELKLHSLDTYEHSLRVAKLCVSFGKTIGLNDADIEKLQVASLLHDIGKLKVSNEILHKPAKLTDKEYGVVKNHPIYGASLLLQAGFKNREVLNLVACHHERLDGLGYPQGLDKDSLPPLERIITLCDSYDAMNSNRPYHRGYPLEYIIREINDNAGTQFDLKYAKMFIDYLEKSSLKEENIRNRK